MGVGAAANLNTKIILSYLVAESKYIQGIFKPKNPEKYIGDVNNIVFRSSYERKLFQWCDQTSSVKKWASEEIAISYFDPTTLKNRRYFPDVLFELVDKDGNTKKYLAEVKPERQTRPPNPSPKKKTRTWLNENITYQKNLAKWEAAERFCQLNGLEFIKITEKELGIK